MLANVQFYEQCSFSWLQVIALQCALLLAFSPVLGFLAAGQLAACAAASRRSMDEFDVGDAVPAPPAPQTVARRSKGGSSATGSSTGERTKKLCGFNPCDDDAKQGRRHCALHNRHLDNARNQVEKKLGSDGLKAWVEKCKDIEYANGQIEYMAKRSGKAVKQYQTPHVDPGSLVVSDDAPLHLPLGW